MTNKNKNFKYYRKKILVLGLGNTGKSIIKFLEEKECQVSYWDDKVLNETFSKSKRLENKNTNLSFFDYIFVSPGISKKHFIVKKALKYRLRLLTDIDLFLYIIKVLKLKSELICITGTNGKSTVAQILANFFRNKPLANFGNLVLRNIPKSNTSLILELSSFQLDYINRIKPKVAVITNIKKDHLLHHGTYKNYINSKLKISEFQNIKDFIILNYDDPNLRKIFSQTKRTKAKLIWVSEKKALNKGVFIRDNIINDNYFGDKKIPLNDNSIFDLSHNRLNAAIAFTVLRALKHEINIIQKSINKFKGLPHRLELIGKIKNTKFFNDSKATNVAATCSALESFNKVILIAGGSNKGESFNELKKYINKIHAAYLFGETANEISLSLGLLKVNVICDNLKDAIYKAFSFSQSTKLVCPILLSPASASFDFYDNYQKRGKHFRDLFNQINKEVA